MPMIMNKSVGAPLYPFKNDFNAELLIMYVESTTVCHQVPFSSACQIKRRRYDIDHMGREHYFRGWADVQGRGAANDYCR